MVVQGLTVREEPTIATYITKFSPKFIDRLHTMFHLSLLKPVQSSSHGGGAKGTRAPFLLPLDGEWLACL